MPDPLTALASLGRTLTAATRDRLRAAHHRAGCPAHEQGRACCLDVVTDGTTQPPPPKITVNLDPPPPRTIIMVRPPWGGDRYRA